MNSESAEKKKTTVIRPLLNDLRVACAAKLFRWSDEVAKTWAVPELCLILLNLIASLLLYGSVLPIWGFSTL